MVSHFTFIQLFTFYFSWCHLPSLKGFTGLCQFPLPFDGVKFETVVYSLPTVSEDEGVTYFYPD